MAPVDRPRWSKIEREFSLTLRLARDTFVAMVLNEAEEFTAKVDYDWHSIATEYLDDSEKSEILAALRDAGFSSQVYNGEREFISAVIAGKWDSIPFAAKYAFNTTGSGVGRARTSLIPSFCDLCRIPICSSDGYSSALLENKFHTFRLLEVFGLPAPRSYLYERGKGWKDRVPDQMTRIICQPCYESSSIGVDERSIFEYETSSDRFLDQMSAVFRQPLLVQDFISGYEVEVPVFTTPDPISPTAVGVTLEETRVLGDRVLTNDRIVKGDYDFYDFAEVDKDISERLKAVSEATYSALGLSGLVRVDYRVTSSGQIFITDVNTPPHLTAHSSCRFAFDIAGYSHANLMAALVTVGRLRSQS